MMGADQDAAMSNGTGTFAKWIGLLAIGLYAAIALFGPWLMGAPGQ